MKDKPLNESLESRVGKLLRGDTLGIHDLDELKQQTIALIQSELKKQREDIRKKLRAIKIDHTDSDDEGYNRLCDKEITKILDGDNNE